MYFGAQLWNIREILRVMGEILLLGIAYMGSEISEINYFKKRFEGQKWREETFSCLQGV